MSAGKPTYQQFALGVKNPQSLVLDEFVAPHPRDISKVTDICRDIVCPMLCSATTGSHQCCDSKTRRLQQASSLVCKHCELAVRQEETTPSPAPPPQKKERIARRARRKNLTRAHSQNTRQDTPPALKYCFFLCNLLLLGMGSCPGSQKDALQKHTSQTEKGVGDRF